MANEAASLLDQLMGAHRNAVPGDDVKPLTFTDRDVCKFYLCGFCPSDLFTNTRADIGPCSNLHDDKLKADYEASKRKGDYGYEAEFLRYLERMIRDLDRRITRGKARLRMSAAAKQQGEESVESARLTQINKDIRDLLTELEELGASGRVDEAREVMGRLDRLERDKEAERRSLSTGPKTLAGYELDSNDFHEKMELCDVCGSFLVIGDTQLRVDAHLLGKQHIGYARIRSAIHELKSFQEQRAEARRDEQRGEARRDEQRGEARRDEQRAEARRDEQRRRQSRHSASPRQSRSPPHKRSRSRSPRRRSRSPRRSKRSRSRSPRRHSRRSRSPRRRSRSPHRSRRSSHRSSRSPRRRSKSPHAQSRKHSSSSVGSPKAGKPAENGRGVSKEH